MNPFSKILGNDKYNLFIIALITSLLMLPVLFKGVPLGYDMPHHFQCAFTFYESFTNGDFYPSWSLFRNEGFGGMEIRLYPPVSHYILAVFYFLVGNWHLAAWLTLTFFTITGSLGIYFWAREMMPAPQAVFAACLYAFLPYHLTQVYNTFFYAEYAGSAVLPFCFVFVARIGKRGRLADVVGLAVAYAALILTHLPLTVIGSLCLGVYALFFFERRNFIKLFGKFISAVLLALGASSFFWTKVLQERDLLAKTSIYPDPWLDYRLHFLLTPIQTFEGLHFDIYENSLFFYDLMFLCAAGLALVCTIPFIFTDKFRKNLSGVFAVFGVAVFLATPLSQFIWNRLVFLQEVQFPWRWLSVVCIAGSVLSAAYLDVLVEWFCGKKRPFALIICGCIFAVPTFSISQLISQAPFIPKSEMPEWIEQVEKDKGFTFWWTPWTRKEIFNNKEQVSIDNRNVQINKWTATEKEFQIEKGVEEKARISVFYHPNWQAKINGSPILIEPDENGATVISIPEQNSIIEITFKESLSVRIGRFFSIFIWFSLFLLCATQIKKYLLPLVKENSSTP